MTVENTSIRESYDYNGVGDYDFYFYLTDEKYVTVEHQDADGNETELVRISNYSVVINEYPNVGGTITIDDYDGTGGNLIITRDVPYTQDNRWSVEGFLNLTKLELSFDEVVMMIQQLDSQIEVNALQNGWRGTWVTGRLYEVNDFVTGPDMSIYLATEEHTSGTWATDLTNGKWSIFIDVGQLETLVATAVVAAQEAVESAASAQDYASVAGQYAAICQAIEAAVSQCYDDFIEAGNQIIADATAQVGLAADQVALAAAQVGLAEDEADRAEGYKDAAAQSVTDAEGFSDSAENWATIAQSVACQDLSAIENVLLESSDIVDVFIYDTSKDPDCGAWRLKCEGLSWYRETLNTATRGATRIFPALALIVAEADKVTIFDATDPSLPMWMVFESGVNTYIAHILGSGSVGGNLCVAMLNGVLVIGADDTASSYPMLGIIDFSRDNTEFRYQVGTRFSYATVAQRNDDFIYSTTSDNPIVNRVVNDIAMTMLSGRTTPTIAVATEGGVSVIDGPAGVGTVADITATGGHTTVAFIDGRLYAGRGADSLVEAGDIPLVDAPSYTWRDYSYQGSSRSVIDTTPVYLNEITNEVDYLAKGAIGNSVALTLLKENPMSPAEGMVNYITSDYQSGWQVGDILMATLADTTEETVGTDITTEHVTNSDFDTDVSGWSAGTYGTIKWYNSSGDGAIEIRNSEALNQGSGGTTITTVSGAMYEVTLDFRHANSYYRVEVDGVPMFELFSGSSQVSTFTFIATDTNTTIEIFVTTIGSSGIAIGFRSVSVKAIQNLVENGEFSSDRVWEDVSIGTGTAVISGGLAILTRDADFSNSGRLEQSITGVVGSRRIVSMRNDITATGDLVLEVNAVTLATISPDSQLSASFISDGADKIVLKCVSNNATAVADDAQMYELDVPDRSVKNNPLQIVGELTKTSVNTDSVPYAELVAYGPFNTDKYIGQPYNSDLDVGTGDICAMGWVKQESTANDYILARGRPVSGSIGNNFTVRANGGFIGATVTGSAVLTGTISILNRWAFFTVIREAGVLKIYVDGVLDTSATGAGDISNTKAVLTLGTYFLNTNAMNSGYLALIRVGTTAPSADQIKHIYDTEKRLFEEGALCTLSSPSSVVSALAYDEETDKLFVGTDWDGSNLGGYSEFTDLVNTGRAFNFFVPPNADYPHAPTIKGISAVEGKVLVADGGLAYTWIPEIFLREEMEKTTTCSQTSQVPFVSTGAGQTVIQIEDGFDVEQVFDVGVFVPFTVTSDGFHNYVSMASSTGDVTLMARRKS